MDLLILYWIVNQEVLLKTKIKIAIQDLSNEIKLELGKAIWD